VNALFLSRLQFAAATFFHFLFVPLTLGLSIMVAIMETKYAKTGEEVYLKMTKFWGKLFLINFAIFFLESTLIGAWIFGWRRLSRKAHATVMWLVAGASTLSAVWILTANAWMQHPVGYTIRNGRAELTDFASVVFQKFAILEFLHTVGAAYVLSAFFVMGISAYHHLKKQHLDVFTRSFRMALVFGLVLS
jgi:cytochrome d ubiquinol oxidase subunit I